MQIYMFINHTLKLLALHCNFYFLFLFLNLCFCTLLHPRSTLFLYIKEITSFYCKSAARNDGHMPFQLLEGFLSLTLF